jgi:hypothetical protein
MNLLVSYHTSYDDVASLLAIHPIGHSTVAWDRVSEIFNVECPLEAGGKESTEWSDERGKGGHY